MHTEIKLHVHLICALCTVDYMLHADLCLYDLNIIFVGPGVPDSVMIILYC
jgi:hypothetical protein